MLRRALFFLIIAVGFCASASSVHALSGVWQTLGSAGISAGNAQYVSYAISPSGTRYVAFKDDGASSKATVMMYNGTSWSAVGTAGFSAATAHYVSLAIGPTGTLYVAYQDTGNSNKATVMTYNGSSWVEVGSAGFTTGTAYYTSLAISPSGTPYLAFTDDDEAQKTSVLTYNGTSWQVVGTLGFSAGLTLYNSMAIGPTGTPYVAYRDNGNSGKATVMSFSGTSWSAVGTAGFSAGIATRPSLKINASGTPYLAFTDEGNGGKATVAAYNGSNWMALGSVGFTTSTATFPSLVVGTTGTPYLAFRDGSATGKATVMRYDGANWLLVGAPGLTNSTSSEISLALTPDGAPSLAFSDSAVSGRATVMEFVSSTPAQVTNLAVTRVSSTALSLSWSTPDDGGSTITGYKIERESPVGGGFATIVTNTASIGTSYTNTGLVASTTYNYRVSAINALGAGTASASAATTTPITAPPSLHSPVSTTTYSHNGNFLVDFSLPQAMLAGSLKLTFTPSSGTPVNTIVLNDVATGRHSISFVPTGGIQTASGVASATSDTLPDGTYTVALHYQDIYGDPAAGATSTAVIIADPLNGGETSYGGGGVRVIISEPSSSGGTALVSVPTSTVSAPSTTPSPVMIFPANLPLPVSTPSAVPVSAPVPKRAAFARVLRLGSAGPDVRALQQFLNAQGFVVAARGAGSLGNETTIFGPATRRALIAFQEAHAADILNPNGLVKGTGIFGLSTMGFINAMP